MCSILQFHMLATFIESPWTGVLVTFIYNIFISVLSFEIELEMEQIEGNIILWNNRGIFDNTIAIYVYSFGYDIPSADSRYIFPRFMPMSVNICKM
jgi:hypothetical protein